MPSQTTFVATMFTLLLAIPAAAQDLAPSTDVMTLDEAITTVVRDLMPHKFSDESDWGLQESHTTGVRVKRDGLRLRVERRRHPVNHGTWKRYRAELLNPEREFEIRLENLKGAGKRRISVEAVFIASLRVDARVAEWRRGVQLLSVGAEADARVQLRVRCEVGLDIDKGTISLQPTVKSAKLDLLEFEVRKLGRVGGTVAEELGRGGRRFIEKKLTKEEERLVRKMNERIEKHEDKMRLSLEDVAKSKWQRLMKFVEK